eukprot:TRINITY_DN5629_c0_g1_i3.p1 TRINITY_DN5629_c0_g1~~TRINITY_DN5629_c0_g1_i3.p1  ORF type:complete len:109 (+),score=26.71 TRINITY_DN5629_c0_g1_i3:157-483(+)
MARREEDPLLMVRSLQRVLSLDFDTLFCGHRGVIEDGHGAIKSRLDHLLSIQHQARQLQQAGHDLDSITWQVLGGENLQTLVTLKDWDKRYLIAGLLKEDKEEGCSNT